MNWPEVQRNLWFKWREESPELHSRELWLKYKHEWVEAYAPFRKIHKSEIPKWLRLF